MCGHPLTTATTPVPRTSIGAAAALAACLVGGCGTTLPYDVAGYEQRCVRLNVDPIPPRRDDRHQGFKNVYACNVDREQLRANRRPFPEGTLIVKESRRPNEPFVWLMALARKHGGGWTWDEYTRNFSDDELRHGFASEEVCTACHVQAQADDWIFTRYQRK